MGADVAGKSSKKRYTSKLASLIKRGYPVDMARKSARGYAGGKTSPKAGMPTQYLDTELEEGGVNVPYENLDKLPTEVKSVLPDAAQTIWMKAFNATFEKDKDEDAARKAGWAAVENAGYAKGDGGGWVKLSEAYFNLMQVSLAEDASETEIEILRVGKWDHPSYGKITITEDALDKFVRSFNDKVRGVDIAVDLEHGETDMKGAAAGWFKDLKRLGERLMATISWTELGVENLSKGIYRYFSPEFRFKWKDEESGKTYDNVLFGGALTNRPFIKGMAPVLLSEDMAKVILENDVKLQELQHLGDCIALQEEEDDTMKLAEIAKTLGLSEEAGENDVQQAIAGLVAKGAKVDELTAQNTKLSEDKEAAEAGKKEAEEKEAAAVEENKQLSERVGTVESKLAKAEWNAISAKAQAEGVLTPKNIKFFEDRFMKDPEATKELIANLDPVVSFGEIGTKHAEEKGGIKLFELKVQEVMKEKSMTYSEAAIKVERDNPDLFAQMQAER